MAQLKAILITESAGAPLHSVSHVRAVAHKGLEGDRYFYQRGSFNQKMFDQNVRDISLIAYESIQDCNQRLDTDLSMEDFRRNLVTQGIDLTTLKGKKFRIGEVLFSYARSAPPCRYLSRLLGEDMMRGLKYIGGIRATVEQSGMIYQGDTLEILS